MAIFRGYSLYGILSLHNRSVSGQFLFVQFGSTYVNSNCHRRRQGRSRFATLYRRFLFPFLFRWRSFLFFLLWFGFGFCLLCFCLLARAKCCAHVVWHCGTPPITNPQPTHNAQTTQQHNTTQQRTDNTTQHNNNTTTTQHRKKERHNKADRQQQHNNTKQTHHTPTCQPTYPILSI